MSSGNRNCLGNGENTSLQLWSKGGKQYLGEIPYDVDSGGFNRVLDQTSVLNFSSTIGGLGSIQCCDVFEDMYQWATEVHVIRDGYTAWIGPIIELRFAYGRVDVAAADLSAWWDRRILPDSKHTDTDLADVFVAYHNMAFADDDSPCVGINARQTGIRGDREIIGDECRIVADEMSELARTAVDWMAYGRNIEVGGRDLGSDRKQIVLSENDFETPPTIFARGNDQATMVIVKGADGITAKKFDQEYIDYYGLLVRVFDESEHILDQDSANDAAQTRLDLLKDPVFLDAGGFSSLKSTAPVCSWEILPGTEVLLEESSVCRKFNTSFRIVESSFGLDGNVSMVLENRGTFNAGIEL